MFPICFFLSFEFVQGHPIGAIFVARKGCNGKPLQDTYLAEVFVYRIPFVIGISGFSLFFIF